MRRPAAAFGRRLVAVEHQDAVFAQVEYLRSEITVISRMRPPQKQTQDFCCHGFWKRGFSELSLT